MSDERNSPLGGDEEQIGRAIAQIEVLVGKYRPDQERSPETVAELLKGIKKDLITIASKPTKLVRKILEVAQSVIGAVGSFVSGTGAVPQAVAQRINGNRALGDAREDQKQAAIEHQYSSKPTLPAPGTPSGAQIIKTSHPAAARAALAQWMEEVRTSGNYAKLYEIPGLGFLLVFGPIEAVPQLLESGIHALRTVKSLPAPTPAAALPMPNEEDDDTTFPGLDSRCAAALKAANLGRARVAKMSDAQLEQIAGIGKKRVMIIRRWAGVPTISS